MSNAKAAFPSVFIQCKDRLREFCLDLGAFRALEEYMVKKTGDENYSVSVDFDFTKENFRTLVLVMWAGFYTDAITNDKEPWTIQKAEQVISIMNVPQIQSVITESLQRTMSKEQLLKQVETLKQKKNPTKAITTKTMQKGKEA